MSGPGKILSLGVVAALFAFACAHYAGTAPSRELLRQPSPELAWLKQEFHLSNAEFQRILDLHKAYMPKCAERCRIIAAETAKLEQLLESSASVTPEVERAIAERARMRSECEAEMLRHFVEVSRTMPPEQGRRYLAWVRAQSTLSGAAMERHHQQEEKSDHSRDHQHHH